MFKTLVSFRASYERGVQIDAEITVDWSEVAPKAQALSDLWHFTDDPAKKKEMRAMYPPEVEQMGRAAKGMDIRARFNTDIRGPYLIDSETRPTDEDLIAWAEVNVYNTDKPAKVFRV